MVLKLVIAGILVLGMGATVVAEKLLVNEPENEMPADFRAGKRMPVTAELEMERAVREPVVMVGKVESVVTIWTSLSTPTTFMLDIKLKGTETLRGTKQGATGTHRYVTRKKETIPVEGNTVLVVMNGAEGRTALSGMLVVEEEKLAEVKERLKLPLGWEKGKDGWVSPWAGVHDSKWPEELKAGKGEAVCVRTGRPGMAIPEGVVFSVANGVKDAEGKVKGEAGAFTMTLKNTGKEAVSLPMLLKSGETVLWNKLVVTYVQGEVRLPKDAGRIPADAKPVKLEPDEAVSGTFRAKDLEDAAWPQMAGKVFVVLGVMDRVVELSFDYKPGMFGE